MYTYIDISTHQKSVDYAKVKQAGVDAVILRIGYTGYGASKPKRKDELFEKHYAGFKAVGMPIGIYWYSCAYTEDEAIIEAEKTLSFLSGKTIELPIYFDTEDTHDVNVAGLAKTNQRLIGKTKLTAVAKAFCNKIADAGYVAGIYASTSWLNNQLNMAELEHFEVWVAQYAKACTYKRKYQIWQYTSTGYVEGIAGRVDMNISYKRYHDVTPVVKPTKQYLKLSRFVPSWRVYPLNKPVVSGNEVGKLAPMRFGGLTYEILEELPNSVYVINTTTFGKVKIWAGKGTLHSIEVK